jgi:hypothetical protein
MIDLDATLGHHLFQISHAQPVGRVPAHAHQHDIKRMVQALSTYATARFSNFIKLSGLQVVPNIIVHAYCDTTDWTRFSTGVQSGRSRVTRCWSLIAATRWLGSGGDVWDPRQMLDDPKARAAYLGAQFKDG